MEEGGGGVLRGHHIIWEFGDHPKKFRERISALIHTGGTFQSIYIYHYDIILLFHIPVLSINMHSDSTDTVTYISAED